jgi:hypothetical protein
MLCIIKILQEKVKEMGQALCAILPCWHQDPDTRPPIIKEPGEDEVGDDQSDEDTEESKSNITKGG